MQEVCLVIRSIIYYPISYRFRLTKAHTRQHIYSSMLILLVRNIYQKGNTSVKMFVLEFENQLLLVRKAVIDENEHERLFNITVRHKQRSSAFIAILYCHSRVLNHELYSYPKMSVKWPLAMAYIWSAHSTSTYKLYIMTPLSF